MTTTTRYQPTWASHATPTDEAPPGFDDEGKWWRWGTAWVHEDAYIPRPWAVSIGGAAIIQRGSVLGGVIEGGRVLGGEIYGGEILGGWIHGGMIESGMVIRSSFDLAVGRFGEYMATLAYRTISWKPRLWLRYGCESHPVDEWDYQGLSKKWAGERWQRYATAIKAWVEAMAPMVDEPEGVA